MADSKHARTLMWLPLGGGLPLDLARGSAALSRPVDWNSRSFGGLEFHTPSRSMILVSDRHNDEVLNLYQLSLDSGEVVPLTSVPYLYGYGIEPAGRVG